MSGPWEDFGGQTAGPWQDFGAAPQKLGADAFPDFLRKELANADWGTRNIAGFGTAASDIWQKLKQVVGQGDPQAIEANRIIEKAAPVGAIAGNVAATAIPFGMVGNGIADAAKVGTVMGALNPVEGDQSAKNIVGETLKGMAGGGLLAAAGQGVANVAGKAVSNKIADLADQMAKNAPLTKTLNDAMDAGLVVPPSSVDPSWWNTLKEGIGGKIATAQTASNRNADVADALARRAVGLGENEPLTSAAMQAIRQKAYESGYAPIANAGRLTTDDAYRSALDGIASKYQGAAADFPGVASDAVNALVNGKGSTAARSAWVDANGNVLSDFAEPQAPAMRSLLDEIKKAGGISTAEVGELGQGIHKTNPGLLRKNGGRSDDGLLEWMQSNGWVTPPMVRDAEQAPGGSTELAKDLVRSAIGGDRVVHPAQADAWYAYNDAMQGISDAGIKRVTIPGNTAENAGLRVSSFDAGNALKMTQILRDEAQTAFRSGDTALAKAKKDAALAIENQIERSLQNAGQSGVDALASFRDARTLMAKAHTVEDAIVEGGGSIDPRKLASRVQAGKPLTGELGVIGNFANNFPKAMQPRRQVAGPGVSKLDLALAAAGAATGGYTGGGEGSLAGAALPLLASRGARAAMLSRMSQNRLRDLYKLGMTPRAANGLLQYAPVAGAVLGREALSQ